MMWYGSCGVVWLVGFLYTVFQKADFIKTERHNYFLDFIQTATTATAVHIQRADFE